MRWKQIDTEREFSLEAEGAPALDCRPVPLGSGYPAWVPPALAHRLPREEAVLGLLIEQRGGKGRLGYFPACGKITPELIAQMDRCDVVLLDGTFWDDYELAHAQRGARTARQMGHVPLGGAEGTLAQLSGLQCPRKIFLHINNTNPILDRDSSEHRQVREAGWEIAEDGWDIPL